MAAMMTYGAVFFDNIRKYKIRYPYLNRLRQNAFIVQRTPKAFLLDGQKSGRIVDRNHVRWARDNLVRSIERFSAD
ncbi:hypothetical protein B1A99_03825 [Cohnella sp. CIP 111063]|nr:hypothetical protein B1A99_03825 [Cohnella sp. CIP 111063]